METVFATEEFVSTSYPREFILKGWAKYRQWWNRFYNIIGPYELIIINFSYHYHYLDTWEF